MIYRRAATLSATRLTIGWLWETVILFIFEYIAIVVQVSASSNVAIQFFAAFVIIIITYFMHLWILQLEDFTQRESMVLESLSENPSTSQGNDIDISIHNPVNAVQVRKILLIIYHEFLKLYFLLAKPDELSSK